MLHRNFIKIRFKLAVAFSRFLPPIVGQRFRDFIFPVKMLFGNTNSMRVRSVTGALFEAKVGDFHAAKFVLQGYYDWRGWAVALAVAKPGDTIVEVGANIGTESVGFRDIVGDDGKIYAFEPMPSNYQTLMNNVLINKWSNVICYPFAVGEKEGKVHFVKPEQEWMSGVGRVLGEGEISSNAVFEVKMVTLDQYINEFERLKLIFIDTEGHDLNVLKGSRAVLLRYKPVVVLEVSPKLLRKAGTGVLDVMEFFEEMKYSCFEVGKLGLIEPVTFKSKKSANWVCVPKDDSGKVNEINRALWRCGMMPLLRGINPLCL